MRGIAHPGRHIPLRQLPLRRELEAVGHIGQHGAGDHHQRRVRQRGQQHRQKEQAGQNQHPDVGTDSAQTAVQEYKERLRHHAEELIDAQHPHIAAHRPEQHDFQVIDRRNRKSAEEHDQEHVEIWPDPEQFLQTAASASRKPAVRFLRRPKRQQKNRCRQSQRHPQNHLISEQTDQLASDQHRRRVPGRSRSPRASVHRAVMPEGAQHPRVEIRAQRGDKKAEGQIEKRGKQKAPSRREKRQRAQKRCREEHRQKNPPVRLLPVAQPSPEKGSAEGSQHIGGQKKTEHTLRHAAGQQISGNKTEESGAERPVESVQNSETGDGCRRSLTHSTITCKKRRLPRPETSAASRRKSAENQILHETGDCSGIPNNLTDSSSGR